MPRVLIVEDELVLSFALGRQLEVRGFEVLKSAANGKVGLERCCADRPDLVLMDVRMPVMDGLEATREIMEQCPTCVLVMTAYGDAETASRAEAAGAMAYLTKPVTADQIASAVAIAQARFAEFESVRAESVDAEEALSTRRLVVAAKAQLVSAGLAEADAAFGVLKGEAQRLGLPLRAMAERVVEGGDTPWGSA